MESEAKLAKILDECLARISEGKAVDVCVAGNVDIQRDLEPLLYTGLYVSTALKVKPSEEFRRTAKGRLMARLQEEASQPKRVEVKAEPGISLRDDLAVVAQGLWQTVAGVRRATVPIAIALVLIVATAIGASNFTSPSSTLASGCTLSILGGTVEIQAPAADGIQQGTEGMTLDIGTRVKTAQDSHALLTFFDGSTLKLEPGTDIEIKQLECNDGEAVTIVLKQWMGKTWSRVVKMADAGSHYEVQTPSAVALVRGTLFFTEVDEAGETNVYTTEGLVSVSAQGQEVFVPAGQQTTVETGTPPSEPTLASPPEDEEPQEQAQEEQTNNGSYQNEPPAPGQGTKPEPANAGPPPDKGPP
ncbi:MAG: FecR domain-containing protein, partial [Dehalococcoidales bacterium]|nr:FecR domain-containing protein [Dehalococcoidales bacterium]